MAKRSPQPYSHISRINRCSWVLWAALLCQPSWGSSLIESIRFTGNKATQDRILRQEIIVQVGDTVDPKRIEKSRQAIMDLGLFKSVRSQLLAGEEGQILEFQVKEKYYFFPIPKFKRSADGDISYGAQLRFDNLNGLNQRLKITYKIEKDCCGNSDDINSLALDYEYPRINRSNFDLFVNLEYARTFIEEETASQISKYKEQTDGANIRLRRWLNRTGPSTGWSIQTGWFWRRRYYENIAETAGEKAPGQSAGLSLQIAYRAIHDYLFSRSGTEYGYDLSLGLKALASDKSYSVNQFYYRRYWPVGKKVHQNFNFQLLLGFSSGRSPLADNAFSIGGSRNLRAYEKDSLEGKSFFTLNSQYLAPLLNHNAFRGVVFFDLGNTYTDNRIIDLGRLKASTGFGVRYKAKAFVNLQIRADFAYAFSTNENKFYIGTKNTF